MLHIICSTVLASHHITGTTHPVLTSLTHSPLSRLSGCPVCFRVRIQFLFPTDDPPTFPQLFNLGKACVRLEMTLRELYSGARLGVELCCLRMGLTATPGARRPERERSLNFLVSTSTNTTLPPQVSYIPVAVIYLARRISSYVVVGLMYHWTHDSPLVAQTQRIAPSGTRH